jgi:uncharacterized protein DUF1707
MPSLVPEPYDIRASDAEREAVATALQTHATAGRLDPDELEQRLERAYAAPLRADLVPLVADLPSPAPARPRPPVRRRLPDVAPSIGVAVLLIAIWALTGADYFWPIWPIGAMALATFKHGRRGLHRRTSTTGIEEGGSERPVMHRTSHRAFHPN